MNGIHNYKQEVLENGNIKLSCEKCSKEIIVRNTIESEMINMNGCPQSLELPQPNQERKEKCDWCGGEINRKVGHQNHKPKFHSVIPTPESRGDWVETPFIKWEGNNKIPTRIKMNFNGKDYLFVPESELALARTEGIKEGRENLLKELSITRDLSTAEWKRAFEKGKQEGIEEGKEKMVDILKVYGVKGIDEALIRKKQDDALQTKETKNNE